MGRGRLAEHVAVEDCLELRAHPLVGRWLAEGRGSGAIRWEPTGEEIRFHFDPMARQVHLDFRIGRGEETSQVVGLVETHPPFGGRRWWFDCPSSGRPGDCLGRVAAIYLPTGAARFGCRGCHRLTYRSCQRSGTMAGLIDRAFSGRADSATLAALDRRIGRRMGASV